MIEVIKLIYCLVVESQLTDINECAVNGVACGSNSGCNNTIGSYVCSCNVGFTWNGTQCIGR